MLISHFNALQGHGTTLTGMVSVTPSLSLYTMNLLISLLKSLIDARLLQVGTIDQKCDVLSVANDAYDAAAVIATTNVARNIDINCLKKSTKNHGVYNSFV